MTLEEKIGQLTQFASGDLTGPEGAPIDLDKMLATGAVGSMLGVATASETNRMQRLTLEQSRLKIPLLFGYDVIHGLRTVFPIPLGLSASWNPELIEQCARVAAVESAAQGIRWTFSPMVDIARDARWGRIMEGAGEDPYLGSMLAAAYVQGYQQGDLSNPTSVAACAKHYAAYGAVEGGRDYNSVDVSDRSLREVYFPPFQAAVKAGVATLMSAFNTVQGIPASADHRLMTDILRGEWGFSGFVVSDYDAVGELEEHGLALDGAEAARKALIAGVDMDMQSSLYSRELAGLVRDGKIAQSVVDESVVRILRIKFALGLFERPYADESRAELTAPAPESVALARRAAEESFVLLKNEPFASTGAPILPLTDDTKVALIGPLADSSEDMLGGWSMQGDKTDVVTLRCALGERLQDRMIHARGADVQTDSESGFAEALAAANQADVVVMALGESCGMSGEAKSRASLDIPGSQLRLLKAIAAIGKPTVLVLFSGRPLALPWPADNIPAILQAWHPGIEGGPALVKVLYGESNPMGKLTAGFPRSVGQMPLYYNAMSTGRPITDDPAKALFHTGYIDEQNVALYPFGWGLSYTTFGYSHTEIVGRPVSAEDLNEGNAEITVQAVVRNTGQRAGTEIVQLYINERGASVARPVRELKGFLKIFLAPGEARTVQFRLTKRELAFWTANCGERVEPCELTVWVAPNSAAGIPAKVMVAQ